MKTPAIAGWSICVVLVLLGLYSVHNYAPRDATTCFVGALVVLAVILVARQRKERDRG